MRPSFGPGNRKCVRRRFPSGAGTDLHGAPRVALEIAEAIALLDTVKPAELDSMTDYDMRFEFDQMVLDFTVEGFLLTFSLPNFYFHATTAYNILRHQGPPLGKRDYLGRPHRKT